jgi:hypothetical protein
MGQKKGAQLSVSRGQKYEAYFRGFFFYKKKQHNFFKKIIIT